MRTPPFPFARKSTLPDPLLRSSCHAENAAVVQRDKKRKTKILVMMLSSRKRYCHNIVCDRRFISCQRIRGRSHDNASIGGKNRTMAWANKLLILKFIHRATHVSTGSIHGQDLIGSHSSDGNDFSF